MPSHPDVFPPVEHALAYLREYEGRYDLPVERPVAVEDVRSDPGGIDVVTDAGVVRARYVINATGTWSAPFVPGVEGARTFRGRQLHSAHYRGPGEFVGQRVAVVGGGNSGVQITADLVGVAREVSLVSARRLRFLPDDVDGRHLFEQATARLSRPDDAEAAFIGNVVALPAVREARAKGALQVRAMFDRMTPDGAVIGRDHLDCGSVASPYRETESMLDGSDAIADWPLLNALTATSSGATWVSIHHGGGVGIGRSIHAGQVGLADGTDLAAQKLDRLLTNDPGMGVLRHVDAGYSRAAEVADERGVQVPMTPTIRDGETSA